MPREYIKVNGTYYKKGTHKDVIDILEDCRATNTRIVLDYGDTETGRSWGEVYGITGTVGRSTGTIKIPLLIHNVRSSGGGAILTDCIIGIKTSKGKRGLYKLKL